MWGGLGIPGTTLPNGDLKLWEGELLSRKARAKNISAGSGVRVTSSRFMRLGIFGLDAYTAMLVGLLYSLLIIFAVTLWLL